MWKPQVAEFIHVIREGPFLEPYKLAITKHAQILSAAWSHITGDGCDSDLDANCVVIVRVWKNVNNVNPRLGSVKVSDIWNIWQLDVRESLGKQTRRIILLHKYF